jgi:hypothetical protein
MEELADLSSLAIFYNRKKRHAYPPCKVEEDAAYTCKRWPADYGTFNRGFSGRTELKNVGVRARMI